MLLHRPQNAQPQDEIQTVVIQAFEQYERGLFKEFLKAFLLLTIIYLAWNYIIRKDLDRHNALLINAFTKDYDLAAYQ